MTAAAWAGETQTLEAFSVWQGDGKVFATGEETGTFIGAIAGPLYVETPQGPTHAGKLVCPGMLEINTKTGRQSGSGKCTISTTDGAKAYADWSCKGVHLVGCDGELTFSGGSERFAGITGGGSFVLRSNFRTLAGRSGSDVVKERVAGIIFWRTLTYELP